MSFLRDLALAHQKHEGFYPPRAGAPRGSIAWRQNNPGNLRYRSYHRNYGAVRGEKNFAKFPTYEQGFQALMDDLKAKITGNSAHIDYRANPTLLTYVRVYAPKDDGNNPGSYTQAIINSLPQYGLTPQTPLSHLAKLILEADRQAHFDEEKLSVTARVKRLERAVRRSTGQLKETLSRVLGRLRSRVQ